MERSISERVETLQKSIDDGYSDELGRTELKFLKKAKPMMVALPDPVGEVVAAAEKRNYLLKKLDDVSKK